jgi:DNA-binding phage protein
VREAGLSAKFVADAVDVGREYLGVYELMVMWAETEDGEERQALVADIQDMIDECRSEPGHKKERYVEFTDLDAISENIREFKDSLRLEVENRCDSLRELSDKTGMPVSSLSRFFNSASMPRRSTLLKIADALDMSAVEISTDWSYEA